MKWAYWDGAINTKIKKQICIKIVPWWRSRKIWGVVYIGSAVLFQWSKSTVPPPKCVLFTDYGRYRDNRGDGKITDRDEISKWKLGNITVCPWGYLSPFDQNFQLTTKPKRYGTVLADVCLFHVNHHLYDSDMGPLISQCHHFHNFFGSTDLSITNGTLNAHVYRIFSSRRRW